MNEREKRKKHKKKAKKKNTSKGNKNPAASQAAVKRGLKSANTISLNRFLHKETRQYK